MVMPLFDEGPTERSMRPYATYGLIAANILVFLYQCAIDTQSNNVFEYTFGATPAALTGNNIDIPLFAPLLTLITYQFLHADFFHIGSNMLFLWVFGDNVEDTMGPWRYLAFYFACGIAGGLAQTAADPRSLVPLIGASGAISGVVAAYLMVRPCAKVGVFIFVYVWRISAYWVLGSFVATQLLHLGRTDASDNVAYWCHIGRLLAGAVLFPLVRHRHVELFQCVRRRDDQTPPPLPGTTPLPGAPPS